MRMKAFTVKPFEDSDIPVVHLKVIYQFYQLRMS